jgi:outer membrane murein-binding lipoprotein Lpp
VVEHLIQTRVPMAMQNAVKVEFKDFATNVKTFSAKVDRLETKLVCQATCIAKLHQEMKTALKE